MTNEEIQYQKDRKEDNDNKLIEFVEEIVKEDKEWVRERRLEYLNGMIEFNNNKIKGYSDIIDKCNNWFGDFIFNEYVLKLIKDKSKYEKEITLWISPVYIENIEERTMDVEAIKQNNKIQDFISSDIINAGNSRLKCLCEFHNENSPSMVIYEDTNTYFCFGACHTGGDVIDFYMKLHNCSFVEACKSLR